MRIVIATDSYKGSMSSKEAGEAMEKGLRRAGITDTKVIPVADGGEGLLEALMAAGNATEMESDAHDALMRPVKAKWALFSDKKTALIEMAACAGLPMIKEQDRDVLAATTYGVGEMILDALKSGAKQIILGLGGSATNDCGAGMAQALGYRITDNNGSPVGFGGGALYEAAHIDAVNVMPLLRGVKITAACDVKNPLCGKNGASAVYGPQKGATETDVALLDKNLAHFAECIKKDLGKDVSEIPGAGAAGGLGAGAVAFLQAELQSGFSIVARETRLGEAIQGADWVFTGEGKTDFQSAQGKTPMGVAEIAKKHGVPVICLSGALGEGFEKLQEHGVTACFSISDGAITLEDSMKRAAELAENAAYAIGKCINRG